jgi:hypothetical protein
MHAVSARDPYLPPAQRLAHALEGEHRWGYLDVSPSGRGTWTQKRLTVFPPGTTSSERRALKLHRDWPMVGAVVTMFLMIALGGFLSPALATTIAVLLYGCSMAFSAHRTHQLRARCRRVEVVTVAEVDGLSTRGDGASLEAAAAELTRLETQLESGQVTPVDFEAGWARVYASLQGVGAD